MPRAVSLYRLVEIKSREFDPIWQNVPASGRWCFVAAHDPDEARRIAAKRLTTRPFKSPWLDPGITDVSLARVEGAMPSHGWVGDIAGKWST